MVFGLKAGNALVSTSSSIYENLNLIKGIDGRNVCATDVHLLLNGEHYTFERALVECRYRNIKYLEHSYLLLK